MVFKISYVTQICEEKLTNFQILTNVKIRFKILREIFTQRKHLNKFNEALKGSIKYFDEWIGTLRIKSNNMLNMQIAIINDRVVRSVE